MNTKRLKLLLLLATMDDEAFVWLAMAMLPSAMLAGAHAQVWPDGLGGFQDRETIEAARDAAREYCELPDRK